MLLLQAAEPSAKPQTQTHTAHLQGWGREKDLSNMTMNTERNAKKINWQEPESSRKEGQIFQTLSFIALRPHGQYLSIVSAAP